MERTDSRASSTLYRFRFGAADFDESRFELSVGGLTVDLEQKPLRVLGVLLRHRGEVVTREELLEAVWADRVTVEHVLTNAIAKLRKALGEIDGQRITTVPRSGYRFDGPVERIAVITRLASRLDLKAGNLVPGREHFALHSQLASSAGSEVWLAHHTKTGEARVYKFARDAERLGPLKREAALYRVLREGLGERDDLLRILDWNFERLPFYLECQYGGPNLFEWAEEENQLAALQRPDRIALFLQIADAVAAAHSVGVLHKDLKPTNILVAARPQGGVQTRVADFGSGRLMEPGRLEGLGITQIGITGTHSAVTDSSSGTPLYLAPELIAGAPPTVQTDIYALGFTLYQIVIGDLRKPMASGWEHDIADELLASDIAAATAGDPARRLASVSELTLRLRTLEARRAEREAARTARERAASAELSLERARIRRPWMLAMLVALLLGLGISYSLYREEKQAHADSERAAARAEAINRFLADDLLGGADPSGPGGAHNPTMRDVLARAAATLEGRFTDDPATKASIDLVIGTAYFGLTDFAAAEKYGRAAVLQLTESQGAGSSATLEAEYRLVQTLVLSNRLDEAAALLDSADHLAGARLQQNSRLAFQAHWARAGYYKLRAAAAQALTEYAAADRIRAVIDPGNDNMLVRLRDSLSWCYMRLGRTEEAERMLREVMTPYYSPERVGAAVWALTRIDDGIALMNLNRNDEAEQVLTAALQEIRSALGPDNNFIGLAQNELAELYTRRGQWAAAADSLREAYRVVSKRTGERGQAALSVQANLGIVEYRTGRLPDAIKILSSVRGDFVGMQGEASPLAQFASFYLASAQCDAGNYAEASKLIAHLQPAALAGVEPRDDWEARLKALQGAILLGQGHKADALALLAPAVSEMERIHTPPEDLDSFKKALAVAR